VWGLKGFAAFFLHKQQRQQQWEAAVSMLDSISEGLLLPIPKVLLCLH
jgi:hypothetical protein